MTKMPDDWIFAAQASQRKWAVPASVTLAQAALESGWGLHAPGNNFFGMKPRAGKNDPQQMLMTTEYSKLRRCYYQVPQPFRIFPSIAAAFLAHAELIATAKVYAPAMAKLPNLTAFVETMGARYATDPLYASKVKTLMASQNLLAFNDVTAGTKAA